jgi:hypothetical protein
MKSAIKLTVLAALLYSSFAVGGGSLKERLSQKARQNLVEISSEVDQGAPPCDCECTLPTLDTPDLGFCPFMAGSGDAPPPPAGGAASSVAYDTTTTTVSGTATGEVPNTGSVANLDGTCHSCAAENE